MASSPTSSRIESADNSQENSQVFDRAAENLSTRVWSDVKETAATAPSRPRGEDSVSSLVMTSPYTGAPEAFTNADSEFDYYKKHFRAIDSDNDDFVTDGEIDGYLNQNSDKLSESEKTALTKLKQNIGSLEELHNDETGDENDGVTRADLETGEKRMKAYEFAERNFRQIDADKNGFLTADELGMFKQASQGSLSQQDNDSADYLANNVSDIEEENDDEWGDENDGITRLDLLNARNSDGSESFRTRIGDEDKLRIKNYQAPNMVQNGIVLRGDFKREALAIFDKVDTDKNGFMSKEEIATAVQSDDFRGKEAQTVAGLYKGIDKLEELSNDEFGDENDGVTRSDLEAFDTLQKENEPITSASSAASMWLKENDRFKAIDSDNDKFLSEEEIDVELKKDGLSDVDKTNLHFLKDNFSVLQDAHDDEFGVENDGITMDDLGATTDKTVQTVLNGTIGTYNAQVSGSRELYSDNENPLSCITPESVKQGAIGNCYFESAVASLAATQPELIHQMIKDNGNGTYTVTFLGDQNQPITVDAPTEAEMGMFNVASPKGMWASVLEKAYGKYCQENFSHRSIMNLGGGDTLAEGGDGGEIFHGRAMKLLTGKSNEGTMAIGLNESSIKKQLTDAFSGDKKASVLAGINNGFSQTQDGFFKAHMYSVIGFDPSGADGGTVTIRNPWGQGDDTTRGTKQITLKQFIKNFSHLNVSEK